MMESANRVEQLYESYKAVETAFELMEGLMGFCDSASDALDSIINVGSITDMDKLNATKDLASAFSDLIGLLEKGDSKAVEIANNIQSSELYETIKTCSTTDGFTDYLDQAESIVVIAEFIDNVSALVSAAGGKEKSYNAFDSLRTMASVVPVKYVVDEVLVSTMEGSTTTIPYSVVLTPAESPRMRVENWGRYIYNWMITAMGKISSPWYAQMFGAPKDVTGYDDAVAYVKQVENQIAAYNVHKAPGTTFRAWIEYASAVNAGIAVCSSDATNGNFLIETDNETAVYENGVLTFTGNAILEVTALSAEDGVLYIEDDEGYVKTIVIDTVEAHTCHSDTWNVEIAPSEYYDGYRTKYCDICGDTIAIDILTSCDEHVFGDWVIEDSVGIQYRECQNCYSQELEFNLKMIEARINGADYLTLEEAIADAKPGDVVCLATNVMYEGNLFLPKGVTLDLNGYSLSAEYVAVFKGTHMVDNSVGNTGKLYVRADSVIIGANNAQLPVWTGEAYIFSAVNLSRSALDGKPNADGFKYVFQPQFATEVRELLKDGGMDNGVTVEVRISWDTPRFREYRNLVYSDAQLAQLIATGDRGAFTLYVSGFNTIEGISEITVEAVVRSRTGVYTASDKITVNLP